MFDPNLGYDPADPNDPRNPASPLYTGSGVGDAGAAATANHEGKNWFEQAGADANLALGNAGRDAGRELARLSNTMLRTQLPTGDAPSAEDKAREAGGSVPGGKSLADTLAAGAANPLGGWSAPMGTAAQIDTGNQGQVRGQQQSLADMLYQQSMGQGPSLAQGQLRKATDASLNNAMALGASQKGMGSAAMLRGISNAQGNISQQAAGDSAQLALQEQMAARNAFGGHLAGMRGQDLGLATNQANLNQETGLANQAVGVEQQKMKQDALQWYLWKGMSLAEAELAAQQWVANSLAGRAQETSSGLSALASGGATLAMKAGTAGAGG